MRELAERSYFFMCRALGGLLRSARYSTTRMTARDGCFQARKRRRFYAPLLVRAGDTLVRILNTGVRVLPQPDWELRERQMYLALYGEAIEVDGDGTLVLPCLAGLTLATLLEDARLDESARTRAIELAVAALAELHRRGFTHGDAMADNVMVDLDRGVARWFDFETVHDPRRSMVWRRADDLRALVTTCLVRTNAGKRADTLRLMLDAYGDERVIRVLATSFISALRRPLTFHLGQARLTLQTFEEIARLLRERLRPFSC